MQALVANVRRAATAQGRAALLQEHVALPAALRVYTHAGRQAQRRGFASLPDHTVVGLPALSPTMTHGNLAQWHKKDGDEIAPGDVLCEIETDKATIAFEAQDEGVLAKILVEEGTSDIAVGSPIMVVVESKDDAAAFKDFTLSSVAPPAAPEKKAEPAPAAPAPAPAAPAAPTPPPPAPKPVAAAPPPPPAPTPARAPAAVAAAVPAPAAPAAGAGIPAEHYAFKRWGTFASGGALAKSMARKQAEYVALYGSTGQKPL